MNSKSLEIVNKFEKSWEETQKILDLLVDNNFERLTNLNQFIKELKDKGYNKHFRIGTSMYKIIFSRSINHGLESYQKRITIDTVAIDNYYINFSDEYKVYREYKITNLNDIRFSKLLETLKNTLVD